MCSSDLATKQGGGTPQISINISGLTSPTVDAVEQVYDIEDVEISDTDNG